MGLSHSVKRMSVNMSGVEVARVFVDPNIFADRRRCIVPFHARGLARLAADAFRNVDELRDLDVAVCAPSPPGHA